MSGPVQHERPVVMVRTSGSETVGFGHVRRSLTLAEALVRGGAQVTFLFRGESGAAAPVREAGFATIHVSAGPAGVLEQLARSRAAVLVVDSNDVGEQDMELLHAAVPLVIVDDLCTRRITADVITNSAAYAQELAYPRTPDCRLLLGPHFALLRNGFADPPPAVAPRARRALVTLGGSDPHDMTPRAVAWTREECPHVQVAVVVGPYFSNRTSIERSGADEILVNPCDMPSVIRSADVAVSGGGQTTYELAASGVPTLAVQVGGDQRRNLEALHAHGVLVHAGHASDPGIETSFRRSIRRLTSDSATRSEMAQRGRALVDGRGAERVAEAVLEVAASRGEPRRARAGER